MFFYRVTAKYSLVFLICLSVLTVNSDLLGQVSVSFSKITDLQFKNEKADKLFSSRTFSLDHNSLSELIHQNNLVFKFQDEQTFKIDIEEVRTISSNHTINLATENSAENIVTEITKPIHIIKGKVNSIDNSQAFFVQTESGIEGFIKTSKAKYYLEKIQSTGHSKSTDYIFYEAKDVVDKTINCMVNEQNITQSYPQSLKSGSQTCLNLDIAVAVDFEYFQKFNYNIEEVIARTITVVNASTVDFATAFESEISLSISEHFISTCYNCNPWGNDSDALSLLDKFGHWAEEGGFTNSYDLGQLWTGNDLEIDQNSNTIGYANKGGLCSDKRYHVLEDFSETLWKLKHLVTHEIGHNLNASHDSYTSNTIMSPSLFDTNIWSNNSITAINSFVNGISCVGACYANSCLGISGITIDDYNSSFLSFSWDQTDSTKIILFEEDRNEILFNYIINDNTARIHYPFSGCENYSLKLSSICNGIESPISTLLIGSPEELFTKFLDVKVGECSPGMPSDYNLELTIDHNGIQGEPFYIDVLGQTNVFYFENSPQIVNIHSSQINTNQNQFPIQVFAILRSKLYCLDAITFNERPNSNCDLFVNENFDDCVLPVNWGITSTNNNYYPFPYSWKFDNNSRKIINYGKSLNATKDKTIDGSCMAYFDDDIINRQEYTGLISLFSDHYDLSDYENISLNFSYIFHNFSDGKNANDSYFAFEVWDGQSWITELFDNQILCPWSDVWNAQCTKIFTIDLQQYAHSDFQCRFIFSDGNEGDWTGMIALDNFSITGDRIITYGCTTEGSVNFDPTADFDDGSCYSCDNAIMDGEETGIDCGGPDCAACIIPCDQEELYVSEIESDLLISNVEDLYVTAIINNHDVQLKPAVSLNLEQGFEIKLGATMSAIISACEE